MVVLNPSICGFVGTKGGKSLVKYAAGLGPSLQHGPEEKLDDVGI